jgi:hypothetical protein
MADTRAQAYAQQLDLLTKQAEALTPEARRRIVKLLDDANREIMADVARSNPESYNAARLHALKAQIDRVMQEFAQQAASQISDFEDKTYRQTALQVDATISAGTGSLMVQPVIDRALLQVVQGYTADLITGLTHDMSARINAAIQRAALGGSNLQQLVEQIGRTLEGGEFSGLFSQVGERAMSIATNEIMRVQSLASVARINDLAPHHPGLAKRWLHIPVARVPRVSHLLADGQVQKPGLVQPYLSDEQLKPTDQERQLLKSYGISVERAA